MIAALYHWRESLSRRIGKGAVMAAVTPGLIRGKPCHPGHFSKRAWMVGSAKWPSDHDDLVWAIVPLELCQQNGAGPLVFLGDLVVPFF
jgi:hypothetical protein